MKAFESLVGELLDKCEVTQARRICAFFGKTAPDLEYVLVSHRWMNAVSLAFPTKLKSTSN